MIRNLALIGASLLLGLVLAEIIARIAKVSYRLFYAPDEHIGARAQPNFAAWFTLEGRAWVTTNSSGFRDREHSVIKPPDTYRIAVLGDSYAEALQVSTDKTFWSVLETELADTEPFEHRAIEVLNFGISGFGTAQEYLLLEHEVIAYQPDLVLLAFLTGNDVRNNSKELETAQVRPFYSLVNGELILDNSFRQHPDFIQMRSPWTRFKVSCINHSRLLQLVYHLREQKTETQPSGKLEAGLDNAIYQRPQSNEWEVAWAVTERLILAMRETSAAAGAEFVVVTLTNPIQVEIEDSIREEFMQRLGISDLDYADRRIRELGLRSGLSVINLSETLHAYAQEHDVQLHGFENSGLGHGHWNAAGHRIAGQTIARELRTLFFDKAKL